MHQCTTIDNAGLVNFEVLLVSFINTKDFHISVLQVFTYYKLPIYTEHKDGKTKFYTSTIVTITKSKSSYSIILVSFTLDVFAS